MGIAKLSGNSLFLWIVLVIFLPIYLIGAFPYYSGDVKNHVVWADSLLRYGPNDFYSREFKDFAFPNYPPLAMGSFALSLKTYQLINSAVWLINRISFFPSRLVFLFQDEHMRIAFLKLPAILANLGLAGTLFYLGREVFGEKKRTVNFNWFIFLINPALIYLSVIWGQFDLLPVFFLILSFLMLFKDKTVFSAVFISCGLLTKQTLIIFWPFFLYYLFRKKGLKATMENVLITVVLFYLSYIPFHSFSFGFAPSLYQLNFDLVAHTVGENAFNLWGLLFDFRSVSDSQKFLGFSFQIWGYILFIISLIPAGVILLKRKINPERLFLLLLYISSTDFFFLTRMHERYLAPAVVISLAAATFNKRAWIPAVVLSMVFLLNLYHGLYQPSIPMFDNLVRSLVVLKILVIGLAAVTVYNFYLYVKQK